MGRSGHLTKFPGPPPSVLLPTHLLSASSRPRATGKARASSSALGSQAVGHLWLLGHGASGHAADGRGSAVVSRGVDTNTEQLRVDAPSLTIGER